jgi:hypothetical protein
MLSKSFLAIVQSRALQQSLLLNLSIYENNMICKNCFIILDEVNDSL